MTPPQNPTTGMPAPSRICWLLVLGFHATAAIGWWWMSPGGFPIDEPWFWRNRIAPIVVVAGVVAAVAWSRRPEDFPRLAALLGMIAFGWLGFWAGLMIGFYPSFFDPLSVVPITIAIGLAVVWRWTFRAAIRSRTVAGWNPGLGATAIVFGTLMSLSFVPRTSSTRPMNPKPPSIVTEIGRVDGALASHAFVHVGDGSLTLTSAGVRVSIQPLLRFLSQSPDGRPTILTPGVLREGAEPRLTAAEAFPGGLDLRYKLDHPAALRVEVDEAGEILMDAWASLSSPVWSHLNAYCDVDVSGAKRPSLAFSPCGDQRFEIRPVDYPSGRPLRFAYLDSAAVFHVVEATSGEKGPFHELGSGPLHRGAPLTLTLYDEDRPIASWTLEDWSAQASTQLSPTAGFGVPENAIEFCLSDPGMGRGASIYVTLAATSVGRGWDCVGHAAGGYRNRVRIHRSTPDS